MDPDSVRDCSTGSPVHNPAPGASRGPVVPSYGRDFQHRLILQQFTKKLWSLFEGLVGKSKRELSNNPVSFSYKNIQRLREKYFEDNKNDII